MITRYQCVTLCVRVYKKRFDRSKRRENMFVYVYENEDYSDEEPVAIPVDQIWYMDEHSTKVWIGMEKTCWVKASVKGHAGEHVVFLGKVGREEDGLAIGD